MKRELFRDRTGGRKAEEEERKARKGEPGSDPVRWAESDASRGGYCVSPPLPDRFRVCATSPVFSE